MVDIATPVTFNTPTALVDGDRFIDGDTVTVDGTTLTFPAGATITWLIGAGSAVNAKIVCINGGQIIANGTPGSPILIEADPGGSKSDRAFWAGFNLTGAGISSFQNFTIGNAGSAFEEVGAGHTFDVVTIERGGDTATLFGGNPVGVITLQAGGEFIGSPAQGNVIQDCVDGIRAGNGTFERLTIELDTVGDPAVFTEIGSSIGGDFVLRRATIIRATIDIDIAGTDSATFEDIVHEGGAVVGGAPDVIGKPWVDIDFITGGVGTGGQLVFDGYTWSQQAITAGYEHIVIQGAAAHVFTAKFFGLDIFFARGFFIRDESSEADSLITVADGVFDVPDGKLNTFALEASTGFASWLVASVQFNIDDGTDKSGCSVFSDTATTAAGTLTFDRINCFNAGRLTFGTSSPFIESRRNRDITITDSTFIWTAHFSGISGIRQDRGDLTVDGIFYQSTRDTVGADQLIAHTGATSNIDIIIRNSRFEMDNDVQAEIIQISGVGPDSITLRNCEFIGTEAVVSTMAGVRIPGAGAPNKIVTTLIGACRFENLGIGFVTGHDGLTGVIDCCDFIDNVVGLQGDFGSTGSTPLQIWPLTVQFSNFRGNSTFGVQNIFTPPVRTTIDARFCFWDTLDGPSGVGPGTGDAVSTGVLFNPFNQLPCDNFGIFIGAEDIRDFSKNIALDRMLNGAAKLTITVEDFFQDFTRAQFAGRPIDIVIGTERVIRAWVQIVEPVYRKAGVRDFRMVAYDSIGWARLRKVPNDPAFNFTDADPAQIFRDMIDLLNIFVPGTVLTSDLTSIPDSSVTLTRDYRDEMIFDVMEDLRQEIGGDRAFWVDGALVVHFQGEISTAKTLEAGEVDEMTNPLDLAEVFNRVTFIYDSGTKTVVPKPRNFDTIARFGVRDLVRRDGEVSDDDIADNLAAAELQKKGGVLQDIEARIDLDFFRFELRELITVNVPIMELDGVEKEVTKIRHVIRLLEDGDDGVNHYLFGQTWFTLGAEPIRIADYWRGLLTTE